MMTSYKCVCYCIESCSRTSLKSSRTMMRGRKLHIIGATVCVGASTMIVGFVEGSRKRCIWNAMKATSSLETNSHTTFSVHLRNFALFILISNAA